MKGLTLKQQRVLDVIRDSIRRKGQPPTVREIGQEIGVASSCTVQRHLDALEKKGCIRRDRYKYRSIELADSPIQPYTRAINVPILGQIAAGAPILAQQHIESYWRVDAGVFKPQAHYLLRVRGSSMRDAGILDGDLLAVHRTADARTGQVVVARVNDEVTVKRLKRRGSQVQLLPENPDFAPIEVDLRKVELVIEGVGVGIIRNGRSL